MKKNNEKISFVDSLSTRSKNGIARCFGRDALDTPEVIAAGRGRLALARNIGIKSLQEIASLLSKYGYIDNIDEWISEREMQII
jgi:hypothetical protein